MLNLSTRRVILFALSFVLAAGSLPGCQGASVPSGPVAVQLSFDEVPTLGREVQVEAKFILNERHPRNVSGVLMSIELPEFLSPVGGPIQKRQDMVPGGSYTLTGKVRAVKTGESWVMALASTGGEMPVDGRAQLFVSVTESGATAGGLPQSNPQQPGSQVSTPLPGSSAPTRARESPPPVRTYRAEDITVGPSSIALERPNLGVTLSLSEPPVLGRPVKLTAVIEMPKGLTLR